MQDLVALEPRNPRLGELVAALARRAVTGEPVPVAYPGCLLGHLQLRRFAGCAVESSPLRGVDQLIAHSAGPHSRSTR